jgi:hypothetical protein
MSRRRKNRGRRRHMKNASSTLAALAMVLASGCAQHDTYTPPGTLEGQACIAACARNLDQCADPEPGGVKVAACANETRRQPQACPPGAECPQVPCRRVSDDDACSDEYKRCYRDCGGVVDES